jgi:hypothetical protein
VKCEVAAKRSKGTQHFFAVLCGFYGYFLSMLHFHSLWNDLRNGKPIPFATIRPLVLEVVSIIVQLQEGTLVDQARAKAQLALEWNNSTRGTEQAVLLQKRNLAEMLLNFLKAIEEEVGPKSLGGVLADNKIGKHVRKRLQSHVYKDEFNKLSSHKYDELDK